MDVDKNIFNVTITHGGSIMRVVFMGTPEFAVMPLEYLVSGGFEVVAVYTQPDKLAGRGQSTVTSPVKGVALNLGLPVIQPANFRTGKAVEQLASFKLDVVVVAAFGQILPQSVLDSPKYGCINIHGSLLPKFRGPSPVAAAILVGSEYTGVSIMLMDRGMDTGPVLARVQISVSPLDTTGSLTKKLSRIGAQFLLDVLPRWLKGGITPQPQNNAEATYSTMISKKDGEIDWHLPAVDLWRRVRAFQPWPGCYTYWQGRQLKVLDAVPVAREETVGVGQVLALGKGLFGVQTGDGILGVCKVQLEGKRAMSAAEFLRGQRQFIGAILPES